jgi:hypothetical protein
MVMMIMMIVMMIMMIVMMIYIHVNVIAYLYSKEWMFFDVAKINVKGERQAVIE